MQAKGIPVTYVLFPDEGHGFARPENNIAFNAVAENFLGRCLGGRAEPYGHVARRLDHPGRRTGPSSRPACRPRCRPETSDRTVGGSGRCRPSW